MSEGRQTSPDGRRCLSAIPSVHSSLRCPSCHFALPFTFAMPCAHPSLPMSILYAPEASRRGRQCTTFCLIAITPTLAAALRVACGSGRARAGRHLPMVEDCLSAIPSVRSSLRVFWLMAMPNESRAALPYPLCRTFLSFHSPILDNHSLPYINQISPGRSSCRGYRREVRHRG